MSGFYSTSVFRPHGGRRDRGSFGGLLVSSTHSPKTGRLEIVRLNVHSKMTIGKILSVSESFVLSRVPVMDYWTVQGEVPHCCFGLNPEVVNLCVNFLLSVLHPAVQ